MNVKTLTCAILATTALSLGIVHAQPCRFAPAECPIAGVEDAGTPDDSTQRLSNPVIPREIAMENRLRRWTADIVAKIAAKEGWDFAEISEDASSGYRAPDESVLSYPLRPPHWIEIRYQLIVNKDSLRAWGQWRQEYAQRALNDVNDYSDKMNSRQDVLQRYMDSMNYYSQKKADYMTAHVAEYNQALMSNNKPAINAYEKGMAASDKKIDEFTRKISALQNPQSAQTANENRDAEKTRQTIRFHDASVILVEFAFNSEYAKTTGSITPAAANNSATNNSTANNSTANNSAAGSSVTNSATTSAKTIWFTNPSPDLLDMDLFRHSRFIALQLFGSWKRTSDGEGYIPTYNTDKTNIDQTTPKKIKSDQVRTIFCRLSGNAPAIRRWLNDINPSTPESLLAN